MADDELVGDVVKVIANDLWLRTDTQNVIAGALDQRRFPARRDGAKRVPGMAGDKTELGGLRPKLLFDIAVSLARRLMMPHGIGAKSSLKQIDNAAMFELTGLNAQQIVGKREESETGVT